MRIRHSTRPRVFRLRTRAGCPWHGLPARVLRRPAYTYIEVMTVVMVASIVTMVAMPNSQTNVQAEGQAVAIRLEGDISYARNQSIARPDDKLVIRIADDSRSYWVARAATPNTVITHPISKKPYIVYFGTLGNLSVTQIQIAGNSIGADRALGFDAFGSLDQTSPAYFTFTVGTQSLMLSVDPITAEVGTVN